MKKIIIFGMGQYFECKRESILKKYNVSCFCDNKISQGKYQVFQDTEIKIMNPLDLNKDDTAEIFLMSVHFIDMWKQLISIGIKPERLVYPYFEEPYFENDEALSLYLKKIEFHNEKFVCLLKNGDSVEISNDNEWRELLRKAYKNRYLLIDTIAKMEIEPISKQFGTERGTPIDRYYIRQFLMKNRNYIHGDVLEIEDSTYTYEFGGEAVQNAIVMDVNSKAENITFNANLETGEGICENVADCFILTQTLMYIFDLKTTAKSIAALLKKDGVALITCSGISQNSRRCMDNYGCYFNFNKDALVKMFELERDLKVLEVGSYGNVKTVSAHINGLCCEDLVEDDFKHNDKYYPLIVYAVVKKIE